MPGLCSSSWPATASAARLTHDGWPAEFFANATMVCPRENGFSYFLPSISSMPPYSYSVSSKSGLSTRSVTALRFHSVPEALEVICVLSNASWPTVLTVAGSTTSAPAMSGMLAKARLPMVCTPSPMEMERTWAQPSNA